jgi:hypothetical protein
LRQCSGRSNICRKYFVSVREQLEEETKKKKHLHLRTLAVCVRSVIGTPEAINENIEPNCSSHPVEAPVIRVVITFGYAHGDAPKPGCAVPVGRPCGDVASKRAAGVKGIGKLGVYPEVEICVDAGLDYVGRGEFPGGILLGKLL